MHESNLDYCVAQNNASLALHQKSDFFNFVGMLTHALCRSLDGNLLTEIDSVFYSLPHVTFYWNCFPDVVEHNVHCPDCGDNICEREKGEDCNSCQDDCACLISQICFENGICGDFCGNSECDLERGENCNSCPADCICQNDELCYGDGSCGSPCGDSVCDSGQGENCTSCFADCACDSGQSCYADGICGSPCGDSVCDLAQGEDCVNCEDDCECGACVSSLDCANYVPEVVALETNNFCRSADGDSRSCQVVSLMPLEINLWDPQHSAIFLRDVPTAVVITVGLVPSEILTTPWTWLMEFTKINSPQVDVSIAVECNSVQPGLSLSGTAVCFLPVPTEFLEATAYNLRSRVEITHYPVEDQQRVASVITTYSTSPIRVAEEGWLQEVLLDNEHCGAEGLGKCDFPTPVPNRRNSRGVVCCYQASLSLVRLRLASGLFSFTAEMNKRLLVKWDIFSGTSVSYEEVSSNLGFTTLGETPWSTSYSFMDRPILTGENVQYQRNYGDYSAFHFFSAHFSGEERHTVSTNLLRYVFVGSAIAASIASQLQITSTALLAALTMPSDFRYSRIVDGSIGLKTDEAFQQPISSDPWLESIALGRSDRTEYHRLEIGFNMGYSVKLRGFSMSFSVGEVVGALEKYLRIGETESDWDGSIVLRLQPQILQWDLGCAYEVVLFSDKMDRVGDCSRRKKRSLVERDNNSPPTVIVASDDIPKLMFRGLNQYLGEELVRIVSFSDSVISLIVIDLKGDTPTFVHGRLCSHYPLPLDSVVGSEGYSSFGLADYTQIAQQIVTGHTKSISESVTFDTFNPLSDDVLTLRAKFSSVTHSIANTTEEIDVSYQSTPPEGFFDMSPQSVFLEDSGKLLGFWLRDTDGRMLSYEDREFWYVSGTVMQSENASTVVWSAEGLAFAFPSGDTFSILRVSSSKILVIHYDFIEVNEKYIRVPMLSFYDESNDQWVARSNILYGEIGIEAAVVEEVHATPVSPDNLLVTYVNENSIIIWALISHSTAIPSFVSWGKISDSAVPASIIQPVFLETREKLLLVWSGENKLFSCEFNLENRTVQQPYNLFSEDPFIEITELKSITDLSVTSWSDHMFTLLLEGTETGSDDIVHLIMMGNEEGLSLESFLDCDG